ncbi:hypothetical protein ACH5RR_002349 [Cinchona calisaya]|uniref:F-box protein n=1 Tax=Cinchona calisaya TaxID=153742 RepID=A0ABD3B6V7_9GENT
MMSDHFVHAYNGSDGKSGQSMHSYHSAWMSHWTRKSYDAEVQNHNCSSSFIGNKKNSRAASEYQLTGKEIVSDICRPTKELREIETGTLKLRNESLRITSTTVGTDKLEFLSFPIDDSGKNGESTPTIKDSKATCGIEELKPQINYNLDSDIPVQSLKKSYNPPLLTMAPDASKTRYRDCHSEPEGVIKNSREPLENSPVFRDSSFGILRPLREDFTRSTTDMVQGGFDHGNGRITLHPSIMCRPALASGEQLRFIESENLDYLRHSTFLVCEEKIESHSNSGRSLTSYLQQNKASLFQTGPSTSNNPSPAFGEKFSKMQNFSGIRFFQNHSNFSEATRTEKLPHGCNSLRKFPHSLQDMETMRICTTVDSVVPLRQGHPSFSQTTHSLLITKKTDLNSYNEKQTLRSLRESDSEEKYAGDVNPSCRTSNAEDVKALGHSTDSRGKKVQDDFELKNESSAETDTMDIDDFKEKNQLSSVNSSPPIKVLGMGFIAPQSGLHNTSRENRLRQHDTQLPDINLELPALPSADNVDPSSSRTQSLDMETFLAHAEQPSHSESDCCLGSFSKPEPSNRWIKRLRSSASGSSALGTKSSNIGEGSCHEKNNLSLGKILKCSTANSEPTVSKLHGKELMVLDKSTAFEKYGESSSLDTAKKGRDSLYSLSWIRRWGHNQSAAPGKKHENVVVCEPEHSKMAFEDLEEKQQFPSIAAMALVGKAMKGFQPCVFQKRGSFMVWNTR